MAARQKKKTPAKKPKRARSRRRFGWKIGMAALSLIALGAGAMYANAKIVHVRYAEVMLEDLPASFDGTTVLFASDFDLSGGSARKMFKRLQPLQPDLLLLGGDYASPTLLERLNGSTGAGETEARKAFFDSLADFHAPLGKLAVSGEHDGDADGLNIAMIGTGVRLIDGGVQTISNGTDEIYIAGIGEGTRDVSSIAGHMRSDQCVIALMHRPSRVVDVRIAEAGDSGPWADLSLAGHNHGGQIQIAGRTALTLDDADKRLLSGWSTDGGLTLVTSGVGCEGISLRLGSTAEVWMITLRKK